MYAALVLVLYYGNWRKCVTWIITRVLGREREREKRWHIRQVGIVRAKYETKRKKQLSLISVILLCEGAEHSLFWACGQTKMLLMMDKTMAAPFISRRRKTTTAKATHSVRMKEKAATAITTWITTCGPLLLVWLTWLTKKMKNSIPLPWKALLIGIFSERFLGLD